MIKGGFGFTLDIKTGTTRRWVIGKDGIKRWFDNNEPVECPACDYESAKLVSRAKWCCPKCGRDFSVEYLFWAEAAYPEWFDRVKK
ncbi:MAG: hypothetical protein ABL933_15830 [Methyloglobulus sp.]